MAFGHLTLLSDDELERIHETSLKILEEIGIKVLSKKVQGLLAENGAEVDAARSIVKIPSSLVEEAVKKAPKEIVLCGRNSKFDLKLPVKDFTFIATSGYSSFMRDFKTGEKRMTRSSDLRDFAILADYLNSADFFDAIVAPTELPPPVQTVHSLAISLEHTEKHVLNRALNEKQAKWQIKLASAVVGDEEKLRKNPIFCSTNCPVSPLLFEEGSSEAMVEWAMAGIPVVPMSMALCGSTAPATIAGTLTIINAENLGALVIVECASSGAPIVYCAESSSADMRTGAINYKAPEFPLIAAGATQLARLHKLPCYTTGIGMDETPNDWKSLTEASKRFVLVQLSRGDISAGLGALEDAESAALEQVILDVEAWEQAKAYLRRFKVNEETLGFDAINKVGPGGNFLGIKHTLEHFQQEIWLKKEAAILPSTGGSVVKRAKRKVRQILSSHVPVQLDEEVKREISQILRNCKKDLL
ncbi:MAG: trimethylamine methyltransferase family protein [Candidatus Bathyarchaeota archaeon]|nr:MAG: trimethylamine methyltransferase family protein [Candidatus Bathyarchaeota archaeon]